jgi:hypothetical protein
MSDERWVLVRKDPQENLTRGRRELNKISLEGTSPTSETKGRLLSAIEEMNRVARIAFYERSEIAGQFNKDLVRRGRRTAGAKGVAESGSGTPGPG